MPLTPTNTEVDAARCANEFKAFIKEIKPLDKSSASYIEPLKKKFQGLQTRAQSLLGTIAEEAKAKQQTEITSYYYRYFLEQISRYNQYFNEITVINDLRNPEAPNPALAFAGKELLANANITSIKHPLLAQSEPVTMTVNVQRNDDIFSTHIEITENGKLHHYYNPKTTAEGVLHQDQAHYLEANKQIFLATQGSNTRSIFKQNWGQATDAYFKIADRAQHALEMASFETALTNIRLGLPLSDEQLTVLEKGQYYRYPIPIRFLVEPAEDKTSATTPNHKVTHVGHASEILTINSQVPLTLSIDPVHYQSGTEGLLALAAKTFYDRNTAPALPTDSYPKMNVVIISHNHHDHMCPCSLNEGFAHSNTLFVVPKGDSKHMKSANFGLKNANVVELNSWNDSAEITMTNAQGLSSRYEIRSLPAKHASNRGALDLYESLYMGYMVRDLEKNQVVLFTGDTGILSDEHFQQLEDYIVNNNLMLQTACIAHGPDRPRKWMECTHQSTADAVAMHARFNMMNALSYAKQHHKAVTDLTFEEIKAVACNGIGYHQGCYRLGVLSNSDVNTTLTRMLATLRSIATMSVKDVTEDTLKDNFFFRCMDDFEREGVVQTIKNYQRLSNVLTIGQVMELVTSRLTVPIPGAGIDFQTAQPHPGFNFDYQSLLQNRDPNIKQYYSGAPAYEYFASHLLPRFYTPEVKTRELIKQGLQVYLFRPRHTYKPSKTSVVEEFLKRLPTINDADLVTELGKFYTANFKPQDNGIRDEGHLHTMLTILGGLIQFPEFREQFQNRHKELRDLNTPRQSKYATFMQKHQAAAIKPAEVSESKLQPG